MSCIRLTVLRLKPKRWQQAAPLLKKIDDLCAADPELMMSFVFGSPAAHDTVLGRISFWKTEAAANRIAMSERTLSLRAELQRLVEEEPVEVLAPIRSGFWPGGLVVPSLSFAS